MSNHAQAATEPVSRKSSPWTSLEVAKLAMSLATPLALFFLGVMVSQQQDTANAKRADAAQVRLDKKDEQAAKQQALAESNRIVREDKYRAESAQLERDLQEVAAAREKALRDEAFRREEAVRRQQLELARVSKLAEKRIDFWEKMAPKLDQIDLAIDDVMLRKGNPDEVSKMFRECENLFALYKPYFSPKFVEDYLAYKDAILDFEKRVQEARDPMMLGFYAGDGALSACSRYVTLRDSAAYEVAQATGLLSSSAGEKSYPWAYWHCEERQKAIQRIANGLK